MPTASPVTKNPMKLIQFEIAAPFTCRAESRSSSSHLLKPLFIRSAAFIAIVPPTHNTVLRFTDSVQNFAVSIVTVEGHSYYTLPTDRGSILARGIKFFSSAKGSTEAIGRKLPPPLKDTGCRGQCSWTQNGSGVRLTSIYRRD